MIVQPGYLVGQFRRQAICCWLKGRAGDAASVILSAVGYNLRLVLAWLRAFLRLILNALIQALRPPSALKSAC
jgi:hypothetical protein